MLTQKTGNINIFFQLIYYYTERNYRVFICFRAIMQDDSGIRTNITYPEAERVKLNLIN